MKCLVIINKLNNKMINLKKFLNYIKIIHNKNNNQIRILLKD